MTTADIEMFRQVIREELTNLLGAGFVVPASTAEVVPAAVQVAMTFPSEDCRDYTGNGSPYLLSDAELRMAEKLLSDDEGKVLRIRVMAARLDDLGNRASANRFRKRADRLQEQIDCGRKH